MSSLSSSAAETAEPMSTPELVFSATVRVVLSPSVKIGALFEVLVSFVVTVLSVAGVSSSSMMLIVTVMLSERLPSETETVTE